MYRHIFGGDGMKRYGVICLAVLFFIAGCRVSINKSISVDDGKTVGTSINTVNGSITIGSDCLVKGDCRSVNGGIRVGQDSKVKDLECVNGSIRLDASVRVNGSINAINGPVVCARDVAVRRDIDSVNGDIDLERTIVERDVTTYNGNITLTDASVVEGDVIIKKSKGKSDRPKRLVITVSEGSEIQGDILVRDDERDVKVILSGGGRVLGRIRNAEVVEE